ncbi:unnamed protein product [Closterium sp. NIES-64]|nr:unnamed protein product [Closterium sp. NIES-64]
MGLTLLLPLATSKASPSAGTTPCRHHYLASTPTAATNAATTAASNTPTAATTAATCPSAPHHHYLLHCRLLHRLHRPHHRLHLCHPHRSCIPCPCRCGASH